MTDAFLDDTVTPMEDGEEEEFQPLIGLFSVIVTAARIEEVTTKTQKKGTKISLVFKLHPTDVINGDNGGRQLFAWLYWVPGGEWKVREAYKALCLPYDEHETKKYKNGSPLRVYRVSQANLVGKSCLVECEKDPRNKRYSRIENFQPYEEGERKQLTPDELIELFPPEDKTHQVSEEGKDENLPF